MYTDTIAYAPSLYAPIWRVSADGGESQPLTTLEEGELGHWWPHFLPDERGVLFTAYKLAAPTVEVYSMDTGLRRTLFDGAFARYVPTGHLLFVQGVVRSWQFPSTSNASKSTARPSP